ncbi:MAG: Pr6Pr family membrane protein [Oscillospiraceae bacterium]|nr:Pr6Pr family membrane protein [Oscillospiraceae bacterium]
MKELSKKQSCISVVLKVITILSAVTGTAISAFAAGSTFMGGKVVFMYFTIQSNIAIAVICAVGLYLMLSRKKIPDVWYLIKFVSSVSITLTGVVFCAVLAPTLGDKAWNLQNILTHVIVPLAAVADMFVTGVSGGISKRGVLWCIVPPIIYAIYAGIGYVRGWKFSTNATYPYFFLNWGSPAGALGFSDELPYMGCVWWILAILIFLLAVGYGYRAVILMIKKHIGKG